MDFEWSVAGCWVHCLAGVVVSGEDLLAEFRPSFGEWAFPVSLTHSTPLGWVEESGGPSTTKRGATPPSLSSTIAGGGDVLLFSLFVLGEICHQESSVEVDIGYLVAGQVVHREVGGV